MSETRSDFPGTTADDLSGVDTDRTASDTPPDTEPFLTDSDAADLDTDRTASDTAPDTESESDTEPTASETADDAELDSEGFPLDTDLDGSDTARVGSESPRDTESAASDTELGTATAAFDAADGRDTEEPASGRAHLSLGKPVVTRPNLAGLSAAGVPAGGGEPGADSNARWREIQANFVDDPRGAVERALQAVEDEVTVVIEALRQRQEALAPAGQAGGQTNAGQAADELSLSAAGSDPGDTERLRIALRDCRAFWTDLAELGDRLG
jgi:hypothetical protein